MNTLLASILDCISPVAKSASLVTVAVTRNVATIKSSFLLIPNSAPQTSCFSSSHPMSSYLDIVFLDREPQVLHVRRSFRYILLHRKLNEIYSLFLSGFIYGENLCVNDSRQCCLSRVRNLIDRSLCQCLFSRFNLYYLASAKVLLAIGIADQSHPYGSRS